MDNQGVPWKVIFVLGRERDEGAAVGNAREGVPGSGHSKCKGPVVGGKTWRVWETQRRVRSELGEGGIRGAPGGVRGGARASARTPWGHFQAARTGTQLQVFRRADQRGDRLCRRQGQPVQRLGAGTGPERAENREAKQPPPPCPTLVVQWLRNCLPVQGVWV